jgi:hypothetical protein
MPGTNITTSSGFAIKIIQIDGRNPLECGVFGEASSVNPRGLDRFRAGRYIGGCRKKL